MPVGEAQTTERSTDTSKEMSAFLELYRKYHKNLNVLLASGALDVRNGTFVCHLDNDGNIRKIDRQDRLYVS